MNSIKKNRPTSGTDATSGPRGSLGFVALCVLLLALAFGRAVSPRSKAVEAGRE